MDNKIFIAAAGGTLLGLVGGAVGSYLYCKRYFQQKFDAETMEMAEYYRNKYGVSELEEKVDDTRSEEKSIEEQQTSGDETKCENLSDNYKSQSSDQPPVAYNKFFGNSDNNTDGKKKKNKKKLKPYPVEEDIWNEPPEGFETSFLMYYEADNTLVDEETEQPLEDKEDIIEAINQGQIDNDSDVIFVEDPAHNKLYHITVEQMAFSELDE